ncbi:ras-related protein Rab-38 isoform X1 [Zophobas morio]|uniref:ras-related protein Rab-38 isoform X1 n=1 Tax=Zophobas morio TaxID=2755281 RepID=UPI003083BC9F
MKSDAPSEQKTIVKVGHIEKRRKKIVVPPQYLKMSDNTHHKLFVEKLKSRPFTPARSPRGAQIHLSLPETSSSAFGRVTPEGDGSFIFPKSVSEIDLWRSGEKTDLLSYASKNSEKKDHLYKILVIGDLGAGKTSIIKRYVHRFFTQHYRATIGVDFALKVLNWDENTLIRLQLWDIAGQERYGNMTRVYYKEAVGAFIVFDVTRVNTFESVAKWKSDLDSKVQLSDGSPIPCVLLANKCDQPKEGLINNSHKMEEYCKENSFTAWFETSAKDNINIDEAAKALVTKILENDTLLNAESSKDEGKFSISKETNAQKNGKMCSC